MHKSKYEAIDSNARTNAIFETISNDCVTLQEISWNTLFIPRRLLNASRKSVEIINIEYLKVNNIYYSATVCNLVLSAQIRQGN